MLILWLPQVITPTFLTYIISAFYDLVFIFLDFTNALRQINDFGRFLLLFYCTLNRLKKCLSNTELSLYSSNHNINS